MKAIALLSGGLDSALAIKLIQQQGIDVLALHFLTPFSKHDLITIQNAPVKKMADFLGAEFRACYLGEEYVTLVENPQHGYGSQLNPCIDCKILMLQKSKTIMEETNAAFIFTGEVLGQRPMSQHRRALAMIEKRAGVKKILVRPLSAKLLEPTVPEEEGWINREQLFDMQGRGRKVQMALAEHFGIKEYPWPGGGCFLTEESFCKRLKELMSCGKLKLDEVELLKWGRHFRINPGFKLIVGRDETENKNLLNVIKDKYILFDAGELKGPVAIGCGVCNEAEKIICARILARYVFFEGTSVTIFVSSISGPRKESFCVEKIDEPALKKMLIR